MQSATYFIYVALVFLNLLLLLFVISLLSIEFPQNYRNYKLFSTLLLAFVSKYVTQNLNKPSYRAQSFQGNNNLQVRWKSNWSGDYYVNLVLVMQKLPKRSTKMQLYKRLIRLVVVSYSSETWALKDQIVTIHSEGIWGIQ